MAKRDAETHAADVCMASGSGDIKQSAGSYVCRIPLDWSFSATALPPSLQSPCIPERSATNRRNPVGRTVIKAVGPPAQTAVPATPHGNPVPQPSHPQRLGRPGAAASAPHPQRPGNRMSERLRGLHPLSRMSARNAPSTTRHSTRSTTGKSQKPSTWPSTPKSGAMARDPT